MRFAIVPSTMLTVLVAVALLAPGAGAQPPPKGAGIYVADRLNGRIAYMKDMSGAGWVTFGTTGKGTKQFDNPIGEFMDGAGRRYSADCGNHRIVRIDHL